MAKPELGVYLDKPVNEKKFNLHFYFQNGVRDSCAIHAHDRTESYLALQGFWPFTTKFYLHYW